jgi:CheY-like chemotaxis protein
VPAAATAAPVPTPASPAAKLEPRRLKILVVDDNPDIRSTLHDLLEMLGHAVEVAEDGAEALVRVRELQPDVALVDIGMPGMDGCEVARTLRADPARTPPLRLIAMTGYGQAEDRKRALARRWLRRARRQAGRARRAVASAAGARLIFLADPETREPREKHQGDRDAQRHHDGPRAPPGQQTAAKDPDGDAPRRLLRALADGPHGRGGQDLRHAERDRRSHQRMAGEIERVSTVVGKDGKITQRAVLAGAVGAWAGTVDSVNSLITDLAQPTAEVGRVIGAVARGDLSQSMAVELDGRALDGEFLRTARIVNTMVDQLRSFAAEVTRVAREVGTEGKLGGQAEVRACRAPGRT